MIHHIFANRSNIGDWLSARGIQQLLAPQPFKEYLCDTPFVPETIARLSAELTSDDLIIIGGGGLFSNYFTPFWQAFLPVAFRCPLIIWGVGCCDIKSENSLPPLDLIQSVVSKSSLCVVRDELTHHYLSAGNKPRIVPCPTFNAIETFADRGTGILHVDHYDTIGSDNYDKAVNMTEAFAQRTGRVCRQTNNIISAGNRRELDERIVRYQKSDLVVTSRLHGCIIGQAIGNKVLAISGDRKVDSFMNAAGLGDWVCDVKNIDRLPVMLEALSSQPTPTDFVEQTRRSNRDIAEMVRTILRRTQTGLDA